MVASSKKSEVFDPYLKWLGIRSPSRPPHHYDLLGLSLFESDADAIAAAAERQMAHVRRYQNGPYSALSQKILNQLAAAKICLLKSDEKQRYDEQLREQLKAATPGTDSRSSWGMGIAVAVAVACVAALVVWINRPRVDEQPLQAVAKSSAEVPASPPDDPQVSVVEGESETETPTDSSESLPPWDLPDNRRPPVAPQGRTRKHPLERPIQQALFDRNLGKARVAYDKLVAQANLDSTQMALVEQYDWILHLVERYWQSVQLAAEDPKLLGAELRFRGVPVKVRSVTEKSITLATADGQVKVFPRPLKEIDLQLANALVWWRLGENNPKADMIIGTTLAYDRQGDLDEFVRLMKVAQTQGQPVEEVFPLEVVYAMKQPKVAGNDAIYTPADQPQDPIQPAASSNVSPSPAPVQPEPPVEAMPSVAIPADGPAKHPVPSAAEQDAALESIQQLLASDYAAHDVQQRIRLAEKLLLHANRAGDNVIDRYVLYSEAARLGAETGRPQLAARALAGMDHHFEVDVWPMRRQVIQQAVATVNSVGDELELINQCREGIDHFLAEENFEGAEPFVKLLSQLARQTREPALKSYAKPIRSQVRQAEKAFQAVRVSRAKLAEDPDDPQANTDMGFYCLTIRRDFASGMQHLAKGVDDELAAAAELALKPGSPPAEVAHRLWDFGSKRRDYDVLVEHAARLYAQALRNNSLGGIQRERAERRILEHHASLIGGSIDLAQLAGHECSFDWSDGTRWKTWKLDQEGVTIQGRGPFWRVKPYELERSVRFLSKNAEVAYVLVAAGPKLYGQAFDVSTGHLNAIGMARAIGEGGES